MPREGWCFLYPFRGSIFFPMPQSVRIGIERIYAAVTAAYFAGEPEGKTGEFLFPFPRVRVSVGRDSFSFCFSVAIEK